MTTEEKRDYMRKWNADNKEWRRAWVEKNREKINANARKSRSTPEGKAKDSQSFKNWRLKNLDKQKTRWAEWYSKNKGKLIEKSKTASERQRHAAHARKQYAKHKDLPSFKLKNRTNAKVGKGKRRAIQLLSPVKDLKLIKAYMVKMRSKEFVSCYYCKTQVSGENLHFDHVIPLMRGGSHSVGNLCCACANCNLRKNAKMPDDFAMMLAL